MLMYKRPEKKVFTYMFYAAILLVLVAIGHSAYYYMTEDFTTTETIHD